MNVTWERPGDDRQTWFYDDYMCPAPAKPLTQSFYPYATQAFAQNQRRFWGRSGSLRTMFASGYLYVNPSVSGRPAAEARDRARRSPERWESEWLPEIKANLDRLRALPLAEMPDDDLARALMDALAVTMRHFEIEGQVDGPGLAAIRALDGWYRERFPGRPEAEAYILLQGQRYDTVEAAAAVWRLTQLATPEAMAALGAGRREHMPEPFRAAFEAYLRTYGCRTEQMYDIGSPTWLEEPTPVMNLILRAAAEKAADPIAAADRLAQEAAELAASVRSQLSDDERAEFDGLLTGARAAARSKEDHKLWIEQVTPGTVRLICAEFGRRMAAAGLLPGAQDVGLLTLEELIRFGFGLAQPQIHGALAVRRAEHGRNLAVRPAPFLGAPPEDDEPPQPAAAEAAMEKGVLRGIGASRGVVRGVARVLAGPADTQALQRGEILVCPWTDPNWTPLLSVASAIVTDTGGILSHAAIVAREFGIPAVVATRKATAAIRTGQVIEVDGEKGIVRLVS